MVMIRKRINLFVPLFFCFLSLLSAETYTIGNSGSIDISLPYLKPEGVTEIPIHGRLSIKIDGLEINGKKKIRGQRIWWWMGADETYALLNTQTVDGEQSGERITMSWDIEKTDKGYSLIYSSLIYSSPTVYKIPDTAEEVSMTYRIKFPDGTFSPQNIIHFELVQEY